METKDGEVLRFEIWTNEDLKNKGIIKEYKELKIIDNGNI